MQTFDLQQDWNKVKGVLKQRFAQLTDDDLLFVEGKSDELLGRLSERLGISRAELDDLLNEVREESHHVMDDLKTKGADMARVARDKAATLVDEATSAARDRARGLWEEGEDYVRRNPRDSLISALIAGFVAGLIVRR